VSETGGCLTAASRLAFEYCTSPAINSLNCAVTANRVDGLIEAVRPAATQTVSGVGKATLRIVKRKTLEAALQQLPDFDSNIKTGKITPKKRIVNAHT